MARIYKRTDRIKVKIDDVTVTIAPLSLDQKTEAQMLMARGKIEKNFGLLQKGVVSILKNSVKHIDGLEDIDGKPYALSFEDESKNSLTDSCIDDLFNIEMHKKLVMVCSAMVGTIPSEFTDENGKPIEGVSIVKSSSEATQNPN
jgi:hypothetical protein